MFIEYEELKALHNIAESEDIESIIQSVAGDFRPVH